jgi:uncharacterized protein YcfL
MKKYTLLFAVVATLALTACGSGSASKETKDSTAVATDTTAKTTDSTATAVDSTASGAKVEKSVK